MGYLLAVVFGIIGVLLLRGIYAILKFRQGALSIPLEYTPLDIPIYYATLQQIMNARGLGNRWVHYLLFREIPVVASCLLVAAMSQEFNLSVLQIWGSGILLFMLSSFIDWWMWHKTKHLTNEWLVWSALRFLDLMIIVGVITISFFADTTAVLPSPGGIVDNLWSALFASVIVAFFLKWTDMNAQREGDEVYSLEDASFIYGQLRAIQNKFGEVVRATAEANQIDAWLMYAILIYENLNRPPFIRFFERLIVRLTHMPLTVGVAQVRSNKPLSDVESIRLMGILLGQYDREAREAAGDSESILDTILHSYNADRDYINNVRLIYQAISQ
jgi:hypothetical protein